MYYDYTDIWLYVPYFMAANRSDVVGMIPNPAGSGMGYFMFYNTVHYSFIDDWFWSTSKIFFPFLEEE